VDRLLDEVADLRLGDGLDPDTDVGPLIHEAAVEKVERYLEIGRDQGAEVACGGGRPDDDRLAGGHFYEPTVLLGIEPGDRVEQEEIFGPVLSVLAFDDLDEAVEINNGVEYGLSSALYTRDVQGAFRAIEEMDTGITYVNAPTIGAEAHLPFGGVKRTGNGHREGGWEVYEFYSETKVAYVDYSGRLQRAQIDVEW
jgi:aldehyde dehydrogenase (NAD+)